VALFDTKELLICNSSENCSSAVLVDEGIATLSRDYTTVWKITDSTEFLIMASGSVWSGLSSYSITNFVRQKLLDGAHPQTVAEDLLYSVISTTKTTKNSRRNLSVIIISFITADLRTFLVSSNQTPVRTMFCRCNCGCGSKDCNK